MQNSLQHRLRSPRGYAQGLPVLLYVAPLILCPLGAGCAALSNPGVKAVPVRLLPEELRGKSQEGLHPVPLTLLGQPRPTVYRIGPGDVLGVWIESVLGERGQPPVLPPVRLDNVDLPPATGFPIEVRLDGTISLPLIKPLNVQGMSFAEAEEAIRRAYVTAEILRAGRERIVISLVRPRTVHVLVLRQDSPTPVQTVVTSSLGLGGPEYIGVSRKGTGWDLVLPAYRNDVLTALAKTGGLPGTDAVDAVLVERNAGRGLNWDTIIQEFNAHGPPSPFPGSPITEIPLRARPDAPLPIRPEDVVLQDGDVVFIPAREERVFYTGGLLPAGEHLLPRDHDLDVLEAMARVRGPIFNGAFAISNLSGTVLQPGLGQPSPSLLTVVRKLPCGGHVPIRVDLNRAVRDPQERILVQAGDFLILQETPGEATARYLTQVYDFVFAFRFIQNQHLFFGAGTSVPGGTGPFTIAPQNFSTQTQPVVTSTTIPIPTPTTTSAGTTIP